MSSSHSPTASSTPTQSSSGNASTLQHHHSPLFSPAVAELDAPPSNFLPHHYLHHHHSAPNHEQQQQQQQVANTSRSKSRPIPAFSALADTLPAFQCHALAGGFSLALSYGIVHPLDSLRVQLQASMSREKVAASTAIRNAMLQPLPIARNLMRGFFVSIIGAFPQGALRFSTYEWAKCKLLKSQARQAAKTGDLSAYWHPILTTALAASAGDLTSCLVKIPREVIAQRLQTKQFTNTADAVRAVLTQEGVFGFYRGLTITCIRDLPFFFILFSSYESIKSMSNGLLHDSWVYSALAGASSGGLAGFFSTPADCVKTRIMTRAAGVAAGDKSILGTTRSIIRDHGLAALMTGCAPRSLLWFGVCGVFFPCYERSKVFMYEAWNHNHVHQFHTVPQAMTSMQA